MLLLSLTLACAPTSTARDTGPTATDGGADGGSTADGGSEDVVAVPVQVLWELHESIESIVEVRWEQPVAATVHVAYSFDEGEWLHSPAREVQAGPQEVLLFGIPYSTRVELKVVADPGDGEQQSSAVVATTGDLPAGLPMPELLAYEPDQVEPTGRYLLGSVNGTEGGGWDEGDYWMWIVDRQGRFVWAMPGEFPHFTIYLRTSLDGDILWDVSTYWSDFDGGAGSKIHRMKLDGEITETVAAPGMHHCFIELPDRSLLWGSATSNSEQLIRRQPDGTESVVWDCAPFYASLGLSDWCHTNSIFHVEDSDTLLLSFPTDRTFVLEVDLETGSELRWFGHIPQSWDFSPPDSAFQYQHGATYTDEGTLLVSSQVSERSIEGVVREYALDAEGEVLDQVWTFGQGDGIDARYAGEAHRLANGNTLHNTGTTPRVREITPDGEVVWDLAFTGYRLIGRTTWLEDLYRYAPDASGGGG